MSWRSLSVLFVLPLLCLACGGAGEKGRVQGGERGVKAEADAPSGEELAREILGHFDGLVDQVAELTREKPDSSVLGPRLETLFEAYEAKMRAFNVRYLALRPHRPAWAACNGYLGKHRARHVYRKDQVLTEAVRHYGLQKGQQAVVDLLSKKPVACLDLALRQTP